MKNSKTLKEMGFFNIYLITGENVEEVRHKIPDFIKKVISKMEGANTILSETTTYIHENS